MNYENCRRWFLMITGVVASMLLVSGRSAAQQEADEEPVTLSASLVQSPTQAVPLRVEITLRAVKGFHIYSSPDRFFALSFAEHNGLSAPESILPETRAIPDLFADEPGAMVRVFADDATFIVEAPPVAPDGRDWSLSVTVRYQACSDQLCLPPEEKTFQFSGVVGKQSALDSRGVDRSAEDAVDGAATATDIAVGFEETARAVGYQGVEKFASFLDRGLSGDSQQQSMFENLGSKSAVVVLALILLGGVALNLTPCVLPMIPINLAIIGAGAQAGSKKRGFLLGSTYGGAIASVYGLLGIAVVLTGATFGSLNASPWFNLVIAIVFILLALAMMGVFHIDLSNLGSSVNTNKWSRGSFALAGIMGAVAALLAGACVAPVVIAVLLLAAQQYSQGNVLGLVYPLLLGLGMGLPWAFAGAGLSFLPKPGGWMTYVKYAFGIFVLGMGIYYGYLGVTLLGGKDAEPTAKFDGAWHTDLYAALEDAKAKDKPLLMDFWATWCKNCHAMDKTTLTDPDIVAKLDDFVLLKFQADDPEAPDIKPVMQRFDVKGLPTYIVVVPGTAN